MTEQPPHARESPGAPDRRIPSLDGLRAVSISLVILFHCTFTAGFPAAAARAIEPFHLGNLGVRVFFVISGFLITGLLLREHDRTDRIDLRRFYLRRTFRIVPPYVAYLAVVLALSGLGAWPPLPPEAIAHAFTYTVNYTDIGTRLTAHFWSLSVEEQFYLLWPPLLVGLGLRRGLCTAAAFVLAAPFVRLALYLFVPGYRPILAYSFEAVADALAVGCLLAGWGERLWARGWYRRLLASPWLCLVPLLVLAATLLDGRPRLSYLIGIPVKNLGIALVIDRVVRFPRGPMGRVLNARWVSLVGVLSYSIYVWQQPFLSNAYDSPWLRFPLPLVYTLASALASYYAIERPSLRFRARLERRWSGPSARTADATRAVA